MFPKDFMIGDTSLIFNLTILKYAAAASIVTISCSIFFFTICSNKGKALTKCCLPIILIASTCTSHDIFLLIVLSFLFYPLFEILETCQCYLWHWQVFG